MADSTPDPVVILRRAEQILRDGPATIHVVRGGVACPLPAALLADILDEAVELAGHVLGLGVYSTERVVRGELALATAICQAADEAGAR